MRIAKEILDRISGWEGCTGFGWWTVCLCGALENDGVERSEDGQIRKSALHGCRSGPLSFSREDE
jgi:hypothetical protein